MMIRSLDFFKLWNKLTEMENKEIGLIDHHFKAKNEVIHQSHVTRKNLIGEIKDMLQKEVWK